MNEFSLIDTWFKPIPHHRKEVVFGIGDDAACLRVPPGMDLLVSTDTLVEGVHFLPSWRPYDIAYRAVMVNVSDMAAMGASPCWVSLALTLEAADESWLADFSLGLSRALTQYNIALIGGDTTRGPLSITLTIHGLAPTGRAVRRQGAKPQDKIYLSGALGAAAQAVALLDAQGIDPADHALLMKALLHPTPRVDLNEALQAYATAAIDISDGLAADLGHICKASQVGALLSLDSIPIHPLVRTYQGEQAVLFAMSGGDDYELCFTVSPLNEASLLEHLAHLGLTGYCIGVIEATPGLRGQTADGPCLLLEEKGYCHFKG